MRYLQNYHILTDLCAAFSSLTKGQQTFPIKVQIVNICGFVGQTVSVVTTQFCCCSTKAVFGNK